MKICAYLIFCVLKKIVSIDNLLCKSISRVPMLTSVLNYNPISGNKLSCCWFSCCTCCRCCCCGGGGDRGIYNWNGKIILVAKMVGVSNACPESGLQTTPRPKELSFEVDTFYFSTFYRRSSLAHIHCQGHLERITRGACNPDVALCLLSVLNIRRRPYFTYLSFVTYKVSFSGVIWKENPNLAV